MSLKALWNSLRMPWLAAILAGLCSGFAVLALYVAQPSILQRADLKIYDLLLPLRRQTAPTQAAVIIDIDEASLARYGQWPWPRYLLADLVAKLASSGVAAVGMDILFAEPDRTSPDRIREMLLRDKGLHLRIEGLAPRQADYDGAFAASVGAAPVVLGAFARYGAEALAGPMPRPPALIARGSKDAPPFDSLIPKASSAVLPLPQLLAVAPVGFINVAPDADGLVRQLPLLVRLGDDVYPSLALQSLMTALGADALRLDSGPDGLHALETGGLRIPVSREGTMMVPFQGGRKTYRYISASQVLEGKISADDVGGRIAFVGTSAPGLADIRATPFDRIMPGVEVHAAAVDSMVSGNFVVQPPWTAGAQALAIVFAAIAATLAFGFCGARVYMPVSIAMLGAGFIASRHLFLDGLFVSPLYVWLTTLLCGGLLISVRFWNEERQKIVLRRTFSRYVSPEVVKKITRTQGDLLAGENRELSILFTDIRGFTTLSESLSPQEVVSLLNSYFTPMTAIVRSHQGTLDKFIGDALMAFWNAPLDVPHHAMLAVDAALAMQERIESLNEDIRQSFGLRLVMGAGVHTGLAYVGNMGSNDLVNYTLIGDSVNLASRLEGLCKCYGVPLVISEETRAQCGDAFDYVRLDELKVKGRVTSVNVYWPMRKNSNNSLLAALPDWEKARALYADGAFGSAAEKFAALAAAHPQISLFGIYHERALALENKPPPDWNGIWVMEGK